MRRKFYFEVTLHPFHCQHRHRTLKTAKRCLERLKREGPRLAVAMRWAGPQGKK
jgi:hypothetical protein